LGKLSAADGKVSLVATLKQSFDYCTEALAKVDDSALAVEVSMFGHPSHQSRGAMMIVLAADWADHYSTAASYLRLNGILPPRADPKKLAAQQRVQVAFVVHRPLGASIDTPNRSTGPGV